MKNNNKTKTYSDNNKTSVYGDDKKLTKESVHNLNAGDKILLNNKEYKIIEIISESTGEAVIYKIEDNKNILILKLYYEFHNPEQEPNTEALSRIKKIKDIDILNLIDYGTGINKYEGKYCFEILNFAQGSDLLNIKKLKEKYTTDFLKKTVIPQIFKGILKLHENRIYHCDLKPQNVFFLDEEQIEVVIGDYGSAKTFEFDAAKSSRKTTTVKGTDFYLPPEQARGFISEKNDFYSFGMILLHLLYPEKILLNENKPKSLSHEKLKQIIERQFEGKPIIKYSPDYKRINNLIEGLTLVDFNLRWGKKQVQQWIEGKEVDVVYRKSTEAKKPKEYALIFSGHKILTPYDLRDYILNDENWYFDMIEDPDNRKDLIKWMLNLYDGDRSKSSTKFNGIIKSYSQEGIDIVADAIIRFFIPEHPVVFGRKSFDFANSNDLMKTTAEAFSYLISDLWEKSSDDDIKLYLFRYEFALRQLADKQQEVVGILKVLYEKLKSRRKIKLGFYYHNVYAYSYFSKDKRNNIQEFLFEYLPTKVNIDFIKYTKENELYYKLKKSLTEYFIGIGISKTLHREYEKTVSVEYPKNYNSADDFDKKTIDATLDGIYNNHQVTGKVTSDSNLKLFKSNLIKAYKKLYENLENEYNKLKKELSQEIMQHKTVKKNLNEIESIISNKKYNLINWAFKILERTRIYKEKNQKYVEEQLLLEKQKVIEAKVAKKSAVKEFFSMEKYFGLKLFLLIAFIFFLTGMLVRYTINKDKRINKDKNDTTRQSIQNEYKQSNIDYSFKYTIHSGMELVFVKGGTFEMGTENEYSDDVKPVHTVSLSSFHLSKYEITNEQFCRFLNEYDSVYVKEGKYSDKRLLTYDIGKPQCKIQIKGNKYLPKPGYENHPVNEVTWYGANEYCKWYGGSLPTEAQWEFAGKGGIYSKGYKYSGSNNIDNVAWYYKNSGEKIQEVGLKNPNEIGMYDMSGNVEEWTKDTYDSEYYNESPKFNPCNKSESDKKAVRGRSVEDWASSIYIEERTYSYMVNHNGFRFCYNDSLKTSNNNKKETDTLKTDISGKIDFTMIFVKGGTFIMGNKNGSIAENTEHKVTLNNFYISNLEITNEQFCKFLNAYGADTVKSGKHQGKLMISYSNKIKDKNWGINKEKNKWMPAKAYENHPAILISWYGANEYCKWAGGRLPTEAEWEYAAKGDTLVETHGRVSQKNERVSQRNERVPKKYAGSNNIDEVAWYNGNSGRKTHFVGTKKPNKLGLYDMSGNVGEWCQDAYNEDYYTKSPENNPCNNKRSRYKSARGGAYSESSEFGQTYKRKKGDINLRYYDIGFRIV